MKILVDSNALCHTAKHSVGNLSFEDQKTGIIFGFLRQLLKLSQLYPNSEYIFAWDSQNSVRKAAYPEYKANRKREKSEEEREFDSIAYAQFTTIRTTVLPDIGFKNIFLVDGFESDDIIADIVLWNEDEFVIVTSDEDLYQLLFENVKIYNPYKKSEYTRSDFITEYGIDVDEWIDVKAIAGCSSDNVKGVVGVGEKTAIKYLQDELKHTSKVYQRLITADSRKLIRDNKKLVMLPHRDLPHMTLRNNETLSLDAFMKMCQYYGFQSFLYHKELLKWEKGFNLQ